MAGGFQASREAKRMDFRPEKFLPVSTFRSINLSRCGRHHRGLLSHTYNEFAIYRDKLFFVPGENGIDPSLYASVSRSSHRSDKLELIFVGGLVPYKACDLALASGRFAPANEQSPFHRHRRWPRASRP